MAGIEEELRTPTVEPGAEPHGFETGSLQADLQENAGTAKPSEPRDAAAAPPPREELPEITAAESEPSEEDEVELPARQITPENDASGAAPQDFGPPQAQSLAAGPAKPRSLFPALAATALAGALLGLGGSYGLRFLEGILA